MMTSQLARRLDAARGTRGADECWPWQGQIHPEGYGRVYWQGRGWNAHHAVYVALVGPVPEGLVLDHTCHGAALTTCPGGYACAHRRCVNPAHLAPTTRGDNTRAGHSGQRRKTHCPQGHAYDETNTYRDKHGQRSCRACHRERQAAYLRRQNGGQ